MEQAGDQYPPPENKVDHHPRPPSPAASECSLNLGLDDDLGSLSVSMREGQLRDQSFRGTPLPPIHPPGSDIDIRSSHHPHHSLDAHQRSIVPNPGVYGYSHTGPYPPGSGMQSYHQNYGHPYPSTSYGSFASQSSQIPYSGPSDPRQGPQAAVMSGYGSQYQPSTSMIGAGPQTYPYTPYNPPQPYNPGHLPAPPASLPMGGLPQPPLPDRMGQPSPSFGVPPPPHFGYPANYNALSEYHSRYYAEYYRRWYERQLLRQIQQAPDRNARDRLTPLKYPMAHSRVAFGPKNQLISVVNGTKVLIQTFDMSLIDVDEDEHHLLLSTWPGPLVKGVTNKAEVIEHLTTILSHPKNFPLQKVWHLLVKLLRQNGQITGAELADLILPPEDTQPHPEDANEVKFRKQLLLGKRKTALDFASKYNLWGHAFALTYLTQPMIAPPDKSMVSMLAKFITKLSQEDSLIHCLYRCLLLDKDSNAGISRIPISDLYQFAILLANDCAVTDCWDSADEVIKLIVALRNGNGQHLIKVERTFESSQSVQDLSVTHDYLNPLASLQYGRPIPNPPILDTLFINEVWEFARDLSNSSVREDDLPSSATSAAAHLFIYNLVPYKLVFAAKLYDFGLIAQSLRYCEQIKVEYQSFGTASGLSQELRNNLLLNWPIVMKIINEIETRCGKEWNEDYSPFNSAFSPAENARSSAINSTSSVREVENELRTMSIADSMHQPEVSQANHFQQGAYGAPATSMQYMNDQSSNKLGRVNTENLQNAESATHTIQETHIVQPQTNIMRNRSESQGSNQGVAPPFAPPQNQQPPSMPTSLAPKRAPRLNAKGLLRAPTKDSEAEVIQEGSEFDGPPKVSQAPQPKTNFFVPTYPPPESTAPFDLSFVSPPEAAPSNLNASPSEESNGIESRDDSFANSSMPHNSTNDIGFKSYEPPTSSAYPLAKPPFFESPEPASPIPRHQKPMPPTSGPSMGRRNSIETDHSRSTNGRVEAERSPSRNSDRTEDSSKKNQDQNSGVFGKILSKFIPQGPKQMKLPDDAEPKIVWDEEKKAWVDKTADESSNQVQDQILNGPPKMPLPGMMPPKAPSDANKPPGLGSAPSAAPPTFPGAPPAVNSFSYRNPRRPQYVDVFRSTNAS